MFLMDNTAAGAQQTAQPNLSPACRRRDAFFWWCKHRRGWNMQRSTHPLLRVLLRLTLGVLGAVSLGAATSPDPDAGADARIARLIEQLGDNQFSVRQRAQAELIKLGPVAFDALSAAE